MDVYANYNDPALAMAAVEALEAAGCEVIVPPQEVSGYPYIAYGNTSAARKVAEANISALTPFVQDGYEVVAIEPTAAYALIVSYPTLMRQSVHEADATLLASTATSFSTFSICWMHKTINQSRRKASKEKNSVSTAPVISAPWTREKQPSSGSHAGVRMYGS